MFNGHFQVEGPPLQQPKGLSVDWVSGRLVWADRGTGKIEMAELDGSKRTTLVADNLGNLEALAVAPGPK